MKSRHAFRSIFAPAALALLLLATRAHSAPGDLYVAEPSGGGHIYKFTPAGNKSTFASGLSQPIALAFDRAGNLFVGNSGAGTSPTPSTVIKITPDGTQSLFATIPPDQLLGLAFDGAGNLYVSTASDILKIAPDGTLSLFAAVVPGVWPLAFDKFGNLYAGVNPIGSSSIVKFAPDGTRTTVATFSVGSSITSLAFDSGGDLFAQFGSSILRVKPDGTSTTFAGGLFNANSLAFDRTGQLFAGQSAYDSAAPAIRKFAPNGTSTIFASGVLFPYGFAFEPVTEKLRNLSARGLVGSGETVLIGGFIVGGSALANNAVLVRALGPSLSGAGVTNPLPDPVLELHNSSGAVVASNNDWQTTQAARITASGLAPTNPRESAIFVTLPTGEYTAIVRSADSRTGFALVEVYSVSQ